MAYVSGYEKATGPTELTWAVVLIPVGLVSREFLSVGEPYF